MPKAADTARQIAEDVRAGRRTARAVVDEALARIAAEDGRIGAFQLVDAEGARRAADELDARADKSGLALAGVPVAIKDNFDVAGFPTRHGSAATSDQPASADDGLVRTLRVAGAVVQRRHSLRRPGHAGPTAAGDATGDGPGVAVTDLPGGGPCISRQGRQDAKNAKEETGRIRSFPWRAWRSWRLGAAPHADPQ